MKFPFLDFWSRLIVKFGEYTNVCLRVILEGEDYGLKVSINGRRCTPILGGPG